MLARLALAILLWAVPAFSCTCVIRYGACQETLTAEAVFIGTVTKVEPRFLDPYHAHEAIAEAPLAEILSLEEQATPAGLIRLKEIYLKLFADLPDEVQERIQAAASHPELSRVFHSLVTEGIRTTFHVRTTYKRPMDDDDDDSDDDTVVVWTEAGECGIPFQKGETYLVYADGDEETGRLETSSCYRTRRVTDAGEDLAYLFYFSSENKTSRVEGFVTSNPHQDWPKDAERVDSPIAGITVGLTTGPDTLYVSSDTAGRFIFDGVLPGNYNLGLYSGALERGLKPMGIEAPIAVGTSMGCVQKVLVAATGKD